MKLPQLGENLAITHPSSTAVEDEIIERASRILDRRLFTQDEALDSPAAVASYLKLKLAAEEHEVFAAVFLNTKLQPVAFEVLFHGTINAATVYPRQIAKRALAHNAAGVIISHNHPSGNSEPSSGDIALTKRIREVLDLIEVKLVDHFIVGRGEPLSFAETGLI